jgi:tetratricopeptide (TPR) repeat protein
MEVNDEVYAFMQAQLGYSDEELYLCLAKNYKRIDNLSKEIGVLESYLSEFPNGAESRKVRERLLQTCVESENFELAGNLWAEMDSISRAEVGNLETWLILNLMQDNETICDSLALEILQLDPDSEPALKWKAESHFWKAENSYQYQMKAYKENRTRKQYSILLKAFKQVNSDFRKSRDYFLKLYEMNPDPEYAWYLGNIFTRLEDEGKANYYKRLAN